MLKTRARFIALYGVTKLLNGLRKILIAVSCGVLSALYIVIVSKALKDIPRETIDMIHLLPISLFWLGYSVGNIVYTAVTGNNDYLKRAIYFLVGYVSLVAGLIEFRQITLASMPDTFGYVLEVLFVLVLLGYIGKKMAEAYLKTIIDGEFDIARYQNLRKRGIKPNDLEQLESIFIKPEYQKLFFIMGYDDMSHTSQLHRYTQNVLVIGFDVFGDRGGMKVLEYEIPNERMSAPLVAKRTTSDITEPLTNECEGQRKAPKYRKRKPRKRVRNKTRH
jgi:hypothetical protein